MPYFAANSRGLTGTSFSMPLKFALSDRILLPATFPAKSSSSAFSVKLGKFSVWFVKSTVTSELRVAVILSFGILVPAAFTLTFKPAN